MPGRKLRLLFPATRVSPQPSSLMIARFGFVLLTFLGGSSGLINAQFGFEAPVAGTMLSTVAGPQGWFAEGGIVEILPHPTLTVPVAGFPTGGQQWVGLYTLGLTSGLLVPPLGPLPRPPPPGATASLSRDFLFPSTLAGNATLSFAYSFATPECAPAGSFPQADLNDGFSVDLVDPGTGQLLLPILYVDRFSPSLVQPSSIPTYGGQPMTGPCGPGRETAPFGAAAFVTAALPAHLAGTPLRLQFSLWDGGDPSGSPVLWLDDVLLPGVTPNPAPLNIAVAPAGAGLYTLSVAAERAQAPNYYDLVILASTATSLPAGAGPLLGLVPDSLLFNILGVPQGTPPFRPSLTQNLTSFGPFPMPAGFSLDLIAIGFEPPLAAILEVTPLQRVVF